MKDDQIYLQHINDALGKIREYTKDGREAFLTNTMAQDAVIRNFEIIGEASKKLSDSIKSQEREIPWR